jgi:hypothetical protein
MGVSCGEVSEGHFVASTDSGVQMMDFAGESIRRKPFAHSLRIEEGSIDLLGCRPENAMELDCVGGHIDAILLGVTL